MANSQDTDLANARQVELELRKLRAQYQTHRLDLGETAGLFRNLQRGDSPFPGNLFDLLDMVNQIDSDVQSISRQSLFFAQAHGAALHWAILDGSCFGAAKHLRDWLGMVKEPESTSMVRYYCENVVRLLELTIHLLNFDITLLSTGYLASEVIDAALFRDADTLLAFSIPAALSIELYARINGSFRRLGAYSAKRLPLRDPVLLSRDSMIARDDFHIYRWHLDNPIPVSEIVFDASHNISFEIIFRGDKAEEVLVYSRRRYWRLDPSSLAIRNAFEDDGLETSVSSIVHFRDAARDQYFRITAPYSGDLVRCSQVGTSETISVVNIKEITERIYHDLFKELRIDKVINLRCVDIGGMQCLAANVQMWNVNERKFSDCVLFLDPYQLQPVRSPVIADQEITKFEVVARREGSFLVGVLEPTQDEDAAVAIWDVSNCAEPGPARLVHKWSEGPARLRHLLTRVSEDGKWDVYYSREGSPRFSGNVEEIRRLDGANGGSERVLRPTELPVFEVAGLFHLPTSVRPRQPTDLAICAEGKTDYLHLEAAQNNFHSFGFYTQFQADLSNPLNLPGGDKVLLSHCRALAMAELQKPYVFLFDGDDLQVVKEVSGIGSPIKRWGEHVYSFVIPTPSHRLAQKDICIEMYYTDEDLSLTDDEGRRLFLRQEFNKEGVLNERFFLDIPNSKTLVPGTVRDIRSGGKNVTMSKAAFANNVKNRAPPFDQINFDAFRLIFDLLAEISTRRATDVR